MKKIAIVITHPIQYYAPFFKKLNSQKDIKIKVFYTWEQAKDKVIDKKFGKEIKWDIPLLEGYEYTFVKNTATKQQSNKFWTIKNPTLIQEIAGWHPHAIIVFGWNNLSHFKAMKYFKGKVPVYFRGDSTLLDEKQNIKKFIRRIWLKYVYKHIDYALYVGTKNKEYFQEMGLKAKQLVYAPHAIDNNRFFDNNTKKYTEKAEAWRKELGFSDNDLIILFVGKLEPKKNPHIFVELAQRLQNYKFIIVGNGQLEKELKNISTNTNNILFLPFQNQSIMPIVYRLGDIFILPSSGPGETWGLAVNEAIACEVPVIVSDKVGCAYDLIENKDTGYIFHADNITDLENKTKILIQNIKTFKNNLAKKNIIHYFSYDTIITNFISHLNKIL